MGEYNNLAAEFKIVCPENLNQNEPVILVEDQQDMRLIVAHHLNKLGYKIIHQFNNGMDALNFLETIKGNVSVIVCSLEMPMMSGMDFLAEIKDNPKYQRGPFALTMVSPSKESLMYAMENGVDEILVKPFSLKDIDPKLRTAFKKFHNPNNPEKVYELAKRFYREGKLPEAKKVYSRLAESAATAARPLVGLGRIALQEGQHADALKFVDEAEKRNPHYVHLYVLRGEVFVAQQKFDEAITQFKKAIELSPLNPVRYETAAQILFDQHKYQEAVDLLEIAMKNEINFPSLHHFLSQGYYALKDYKKAMRHIRSALNSDPENVTYLNQLGIALKELELYEDASKVYNSIIKLDPDNRPALYNKAVLLHTMGSMDEALKILTRLVKKYPDFKPAQIKLAEYEKEKGGVKAAG